MRMSAQLPGSVMGANPDLHGVLRDHDGLAMYRDFREVAEPRELIGQLANLFVMIARAPQRFSCKRICLRRSRAFALVRMQKTPKEIEHFIDLNGGVETVEDRLIHFLDASKRSITVTDYVAIPKMKIRVVNHMFGITAARLKFREVLLTS